MPLPIESLRNCQRLAPVLGLLLCACTSSKNVSLSEAQDAAVTGMRPAPSRAAAAPSATNNNDAGIEPRSDAAAPNRPARSATRGAAALPDAGDLRDDDAGPDVAPSASPEPATPCSEELQAVVATARPDFGAAPTPPVASVDGDPNDAGAYSVWRQDTTIANPDTNRSALNATFYAPSQDDGRSIANGRFALVLVMHGFGLTHQAYEPMSVHMASHGFVVVGLTLPFSLTAAHDKNAAEASAAIDFATSPDSPLHMHIDANKIAVAGHSLGGKIAFYTAVLDPRVDLVIAWDPSNAGGPPCFIDANACNDFPVAPNCLAMQSGIIHELRAETLVLRAAPDGANPEPAHNAIHFFRGAPAPATLIDFDDGAAHGDWANENSAVLPHTRRVQLAFLRQRFYQQSGLEAWLPQGTEIGTGAARVLYKP